MMMSRKYSIADAFVCEWTGKRAQQTDDVSR